MLKATNDSVNDRYGNPLLNKNIADRIDFYIEGEYVHSINSIGTLSVKDNSYNGFKSIPAPKDYEILGVDGVTVDNIDKVNEAISNNLSYKEYMNKIRSDNSNETIYYKQMNDDIIRIANNALGK